MKLFGHRSLLLLALCLFFAFGFGFKISRITCDDVLLKSRVAILNVDNVNYDCSFQQKFAGGNDTLKTKANIFMEMREKDTLLGCDMKMTSQFNFYQMEFKTELFYNGKKNISLNHTKKKATVDTTGVRGRCKPTMSMIKQNFPSAFLLNHYTEKLPYEPFFKSNTKITMQADEKVGAYTCYKLEILSVDPDRKKRITRLFIDKKTFLPVRRIDIVDYNAKFQYSDFTLSGIQTNEPRISNAIKEPSIPKGYEVDFFRLDRF